ncbi:hypothetical protein WA026_006783 [Henosepilachna vigintioctopunctata]|uniref:Cytochrome P450 n=1 Tax=Henosepilachna vigintioctopunctata TaxID=420089 RepID=A0AAW1UGV8_9CUCU
MLLYLTKQLCKRSGKKRFFSSVADINPNEANDFFDIPTPTTIPFIGSRLSLWQALSTQRLHEFVDNKHKKLGPIYRDKLGPISGIFVADSEAFKTIFSQEGRYPKHIIPLPWIIFNNEFKYSRGLFFMDGEEWLPCRTKMNKLLLKGDLKWTEACCNIVIENFMNQLQDGEIENLDEKIYSTFLEVIVSVSMGSKSYLKHRKNITPLVQHLAGNVIKVFDKTMKVEKWNVNFAFKWGIPQWKSFEMSMRKSLNFTYSLVDELMKICDDESLLVKMREEGINNDSIKAIVADMVLAAADTTAYTMQWMLYLVAKNKEVQEKIRTELSIPNSSYAKNVLRETLRLYPVAAFITRFMPQDCILSGYKIPKETPISLSIYTTGRQEKYFKDASKFVPERWDREQDHQVTIAASLPFGLGVRSCIGKKLAEYELQKTLTEIVKKFRVELCNKTDIKMRMRMVAVPSERLRFKFEKIC